MKWIKDINGDLVNLEQMSVIYIHDFKHDREFRYEVRAQYRSRELFQTLILARFIHEREARRWFLYLWGALEKVDAALLVDV